MIIERKIGWAIGLALAIAASTASAAEESGWYVGLNGGQATADVSQEDGDDAIIFAIEDVGGVVLAGESSLDDSDTTWSIFGGYKVNQYFAVEAGYLDLGAVEYRAKANVLFPGFGTTTLNSGIDVEVTGFTVAAIGSLPLGEMFDIHARLGLLFSETEVTVSISDRFGRFSDSDSASDTDVFYGAGVTWHMGDSWALNLDYLLYKDVGNEDETGETDMDSVTLGLAYNF